jgi:hypothetical protein
MTIYADGRTEFHDPKLPPEYVIGLDLGKSADYTAFSGIEVHYGESEDVKDAEFNCRYLERLKLGTSYPDQVARVRALCSREPLRSNKPRLAVDQTGVGAAVVDLFRRGNLNADLCPILIHGGNETTSLHGTYHVPKRELVGTTQVALSTGRLKIADDLALKPILIQELQNFQVHISDAGFDSYEARTGKHDDIVLSLAMALWLAQRRRVWKIY